MNNKLKIFRVVALLEGISFLVLLFLAMPLKYIFDMPLPVRIVGMAHGVLFISFIFYLALVKLEYKWSFKKTALAFAASLLPFGTFVLDARVLKQEIK